MKGVKWSCDYSAPLQAPMHVIMQECRKLLKRESYVLGDLPEKAITGALPTWNFHLHIFSIDSLLLAHN